MSEGPSTPFHGPNMANGCSPDDELRLEAARKRLKTERVSSESESLLDAQIRRMTKELEELKKQRQVAELQEQILAERQLLEASRYRYSIAAASASPKSSPAPILPPQPPANPPNHGSNATAAASPAVSRPPVAAPSAAVQQPQPPSAPTQVPNGQAQVTPALAKHEVSQTPTQFQSFVIPSASNSVTNSTSSQRPNALSTSSPEALRGQQQQLKAQPQHQQQERQKERQQEQRPWYDRPRTPGAPADSRLEKLPPYQGRSRGEYTDFVSALEAHFYKAPQYYSKEREYRQVKLGLEHLAPAQRDAWYALEDRNETWQGFRAFLLKEVVKRSFEQPRPKATPLPPTTNTVKAQTPAAKQPPQARDNDSIVNGVSRDAADVVSSTVFEQYKNTEQKLGETVLSFSKRLEGLAQFFKFDISLEDRMGFLKKGVVPSIRNRAHRPLSYFRTYDEYVDYLQDIEDTLPLRQAELNQANQEQLPTTGRDRFSVARDASPSVHTTRRSPPTRPRERSPARVERTPGNNQQAPKSLAGPGVRSQASPSNLPARPGNTPTSPTAHKSVPRRMSSPAPPDPSLKPTEGRDWWACRNFIGNLEAHFKRYPRYYTEDRKVAAGRRYIAPSLRGEWNAYASKHPQMTWFDVCVFIINQSAQSFGPEEAVNKYLRTYQRENQRVRDFALWLQQFAPHYRRPGWDELRHLYDHASPAIRRRARKDWKDFNSLASFVAYLEAVENTSPDTPRDKGADNTLLAVPRKRSRED